MAGYASPRQRVWFRLRSGVDRATAFDVAAGILLREKPDWTSIVSFYLYPAGEGASEDREVVTFMWELGYELNELEDRDSAWGGAANAELADKLRDRLGASADASATGEERNEWPIIRNRDLEMTDVPSLDVGRLDIEDPQWDALSRFAASFDGYRFSGQFNSLGISLDTLAKDVCEDVEAGRDLRVTDLSCLRALLFTEHQEMHARYSGGGRWRSEHAVCVAALLEGIRSAIRQKPSYIATADLRAEHLQDVPTTTDSVNIDSAELWRFARTFDPCRYFGVDDVYGIVSSVAYGVRTEFALRGAIPSVGNLGLLRACLAFEERRWCAREGEVPIMDERDRRYLAALVRAIRDRVQ